jgi:hypothetical protein
MTPDDEEGMEQLLEEMAPYADDAQEAAGD